MLRFHIEMIMLKVIYEDVKFLKPYSICKLGILCHVQFVLLQYYYVVVGARSMVDKALNLRNLVSALLGAIPCHVLGIIMDNYNN